MELHITTVHEGKKPHECRDCGKKFGLLGNLNNHVRKIHGTEVKEQHSTLVHDGKMMEQ